MVHKLQNGDKMKSVHILGALLIYLSVPEMYTVSRVCVSLSSEFINSFIFLLSDHELLLAKFRLKLKKVGKTTRPFRCDLNQIPYDYTVKVINIFRGLDLIDRVPDELWNEVHDIVQETGIKTISKKEKCKKANGCLRRPYQ